MSDEAETARHATGGLGLGRASTLYIAAVLGTGILVLPGLAADAAGPASLIGVFAVFLASIPLAGTFAALAARFPDAGGVATFVRLALGPTAARMSGYWFFFGVSVGAPVVAILGGEYVVAAIGAPHGFVPLIGAAFLIVPLLVNAFGLRVTGSVQFALTALLMVVVVGVVLLSVPHVAPENFTPFFPHGWGGIGVVVSLFVWAFAGWEAVTHIAAEFKNPRRTIPLATGIAVVVVGISYLALQFFTVGVLGTGHANSVIPLIDLVAVSLRGIGPIIVAVIAAVVTIGVCNAYIPAFANLGASLGRDGHLPRFFAKGAETGGTPRRAMALWAVIAFVYFGIAVASNAGLSPFILINTASMVAVYALGMIAATRLLERFSAGWWMSWISVVLVAGMLVLAGWHLVVPAVLAVAALVVTLVQRRAAKSRRSVTPAHISPEA